MQAYTRRRLVKDFATIIGVLVLPLLVYISLLFPTTNKLDLFFFTLDSGYIESVQIQIWVALIKLIHIITFLWWRATFKTWWRNVLILPTLFFTWQFISCFDTREVELNGSSELGFISILFIAAILITMQLFRKFNIYIRQQEANEEINKEIDGLLDKLGACNNETVKTVQQELDSLKQNKDKITENDYLKRLLILKSSLEF
jgi:hypothetical protein